MKLRVARHTNDLTRMIAFYCDVLGLQQLGEFRDHDGYNGVFLGLSGSDWELEFTTSQQAATHTPDQDDLLVFYAQDTAHYQSLLERIEALGIPRATSKNPYWNRNGVEINDPDGFGVIITLKQPVRP